jgi:hypothetical protein
MLMMFYQLLVINDVGTIQEQPIDTSKVATVDTRGVNTQTGTNVTPTVVGGETAGANILKNVLTTGAKKALTSSLVGAKPAPRPQQSAAQLAAIKIAATKPTRPPTQMDVSKLMPIQKSHSTSFKDTSKSQCQHINAFEEYCVIDIYFKKQK